MPRRPDGLGLAGRRRRRPPAGGRLPAPAPPLRAPAATSLLTPPRFGSAARAHVVWGEQEGPLQLARSLLLTGNGEPGTWAACGRVPVRFIQATLQEWIDRHGGDAIGVRFDLSATLHRVPPDPYYVPRRPRARRGGRRAQGPLAGTLYIDVHAHTAGVLVLGTTLDALAAVHPALARHFHDTFLGALRRWIHCYTWEEAEENVESHREQLAELEWCLAGLTEGREADPPAPGADAAAPAREAEDDEEDPVAPIVGEINDQEAIIEGLTPDVPSYLRGTAGADPATVARERPRLDAELAALLAAAEEMRGLAESASSDILPEGLYVAQGGPLPGLVALFHPKDAVEHNFDEEADVWPQFDHEPSSRFELRVDDPASVADAFTRLGVMCRTLAAAAAILGRLPDHDAFTFDRR